MQYYFILQLSMVVFSFIFLFLWPPVNTYAVAETIYGWNSPGRESLLDECHQNICTLGLLTQSVLIRIAWGYLRLVKNCHGEDVIKKYQQEGVPKKSKFSVENWL